MKTKQFLLTLLLLLGGASLLQAQSTYTWDASQWSATCGSINITDGKIVGTGFNWGCIQIKSTTAFKLPKRQTFLVIKGENLFNDSNNPNVCDINGSNPELKGFTINAAKTLAYIDITSILPSETDFFGNATITSFGITIDQDGENMTSPIITSVEFVAADLLDAASSVMIDKADDEVLTSEDGEFKKTLTFTPNGAGDDMGIVFNTNQLLNNSDMFLVIESDNANLNTSSRIKLRNQTVDGTKYESNSGGCYVNAKEVSTGHYLYIHSFYKGSDTSGNLLAAWETTPSMNVTNGTLYINSAGLNDTQVKIYRLGFYNLSEIMNIYNLSSEKWWYVRSSEGQLDVEIHGSAPANWMKINNKGTDNSNTAAYGAQIIRSMGQLPSNFTGIEFRRLSFVENEQPLTYDIFADLPANITTIFLSPDEYWRFPTMNSNVKVAGYAYKQFKEGVAPSSAPAAIEDGARTKYTSLTRKMKAGYNSIILPFKNLQYDVLASGVSLYTLNSFDNDIVTFAPKTEGNTSNNLPAIVYIPTDGLYMFVGRDPVSEFNDYYEVSQGDVKFVGSYVNKVPDGSYAAGENVVNYGITADALNLAQMKSTTKTNFYRAFISDQRTGASVKGLTLGIEDGEGTTDIVAPEEIDGLQTMGGEVYNLQGVRMSNDNLPRGIYVRNGKKFVVR